MTVFLIARLDGATVACGALRILAGGAGELKRVFVRKDQRGNGFAKAIVQALEKIAAGRACQTIRLETGPRQSEAIALYRSLGYRRVATVEEHSLDSWYFEKSPGWPRG